MVPGSPQTMGPVLYVTLSPLRVTYLIQKNSNSRHKKVWNTEKLVPYNSTVSVAFLSPIHTKFTNLATTHNFQNMCPYSSLQGKFSGATLQWTFSAIMPMWALTGVAPLKYCKSFHKMMYRALFFIFRIQPRVLQQSVVIATTVTAPRSIPGIRNTFSRENCCFLVPIVKWLQRYSSHMQKEFFLFHVNFLYLYIYTHTQKGHTGHMPVTGPWI